MKELINRVGDKLDKQWNFKKIIRGMVGIAVEWFDGAIFKAVLTWTYNKLPESLHDEYRVLLEAYDSGDFSKVQFESVTRINEAVDIPLLDEEEEAIIFSAIISGILGIAKKRMLKDPEMQDDGSVGGGGPGGDPDPDDKD